MNRLVAGALLLLLTPAHGKMSIESRIRKHRAQENRQAAATAATQPGEAGGKARAKASAEGETIFREAARQGDSASATVTAQTALVLGDSAAAVSRADAAVAIAAAAQEPGSGPSPELVDAKRTRSVARWYSKDYPGSAADAQDVLRVAPKDPVANAVAKLSVDRVPGMVKGLGGPGEEASLPELVALAGGAAPDPTNRPARFTEAVRYLKQGEKALQLGNYPEMHRLASVALKLVPDNPRAYMQRAFANLFMQRYPAIVADATLGLALEADSPELLGLRARGYNELGNHSAAFRDADRAVVLNERHAMGWMERGRAREGLKEAGTDWLKDFKRAAELRPEWSHFYDEALARAHGEKPGAEETAAAPAARGLGSLKGALAGFGLFALVGLAIAIGRRSAATPAPEAALEAPRSAPSPKPAPEGPRVGNRYVLGRVLGQGGMGKVYEARDTVLGRAVALKEMREELKANPEDLRRFLDEAKTVASLAHPNIVAIHDVIEEGPYLVFELVNGRTLQQALQAAPGGKLEPALVKRILEQACSALDHAHSRKVVHRDLKPSNVMLNDGLGVKVMDFGISRVAKDSLMRTTATVAGTPLYMAPEQETGKSQRETDLYAMAVCAYEMLAGFVPFDGPAQLELKRRGKIAKGPFDAKLAMFFERALSPEPDRRFHSGGELLAAFADAIG